MAMLLRTAALFTFLAPIPATLIWPLVALTSEPSSTLAANHFGHLALSGTGLCALAAAPGAAGAVYALSRPTLASPWSGASPPPALRIPAGAAAAGTGLALPASCSVAAFVGAPSTAFSKGAVYTFAPCSTEPSGWCSMATVTVVDAGLPTFGKAVAANGAGWALAVGAPNAGAASGAGSTWFCTAAGLAPNATTWACERLPPPPASAQGDYTGSSVFLSDSAQVLVSAAPFRASQGAVFVYARAASGAAGGGGWALAASLDPSTPPCSLAGSNRNFGYSVAGSVDGAVLLVGSPLGGYQYGAATVFERNAAGGYPCTALLRPSARAYGDAVGSGVALSADGNTAFVSGTRTMHVFARAGSGSSSSWAETGALRSPNQAAFNEDFGRRVAVSRSGLVGLVGAPGSSSASDAYAGYVALFDVSNISPSSTPSGTRSGTGTPTPTPSASAVSQTPTPSSTPTAGAPESSSASCSATATPSATPTPSGSASDSETPTPTPTVSTAPPPASQGATATASPATNPAPTTPTTAASTGVSASPSSGSTPGDLTGGRGGGSGSGAQAQPAGGALTPGATAGIALGVLAFIGAGVGVAMCAGSALCHARKAPLATSVLGSSAGSAAVVMSPLHLHGRGQGV